MTERALFRVKVLRLRPFVLLVRAKFRWSIGGMVLIGEN
jgi:hypothetical protein